MRKVRFLPTPNNLRFEDCLISRTIPRFYLFRSQDRSADERTLAERRPSVRKELKEIREEMDREKKTKGKSKNSPNKTAEHKAPPKKKKSKES